jgi:hypothetical protein
MMREMVSNLGVGLVERLFFAPIAYYECGTGTTGHEVAGWGAVAEALYRCDPMAGQVELGGAFFAIYYYVLAHTALQHKPCLVRYLPLAQQDMPPRVLLHQDGGGNLFGLARCEGYDVVEVL